jgi:hypothetical protein
MTPISRTPAKSISPVRQRSTLFVSRRFSGRIGGVVTARRMERLGKEAEIASDFKYAKI